VTVTFDIHVVLGIGCLAIAVGLLLSTKLRRRFHLPQQRHALVASHMRTYDPRKSA